MTRPRLNRWVCAALVAAVSAPVTLGAGPAAAAPASSALATSRTHLLRVRPRIPPGLEAGMPRASAYARGIALDLQERFDEAAARYREARLEFDRMKTPPPGGPRVLEGWRRKARWQSYWSQQLRLRRRGYRPWGGTATGELGIGYYMKFLAARAFTGRAPLPLALKARAHLETALRTQPDHAIFRLTLAALLHELGDPAQGQREYARLTLRAAQRVEPMLAVRLAAYHVAAGDPDQALVDLERALGHPYMHRSVSELLDWSNEFDRVRDDPRFRRLLDRARRPRPARPRGRFP